MQEEKPCEHAQSKAVSKPQKLLALSVAKPSVCDAVWRRWAGCLLRCGQGKAKQHELRQGGRPEWEATLSMTLRSLRPADAGLITMLAVYDYSHPSFQADVIRWLLARWGLRGFLYVFDSILVWDLQRCGSALVLCQIKHRAQSCNAFHDAREDVQSSVHLALAGKTDEALKGS